MIFIKCSFRSYLQLFVLSLVMVASSVLAVAPANDDFANAILVAGASGTSNGTNVDATAEANEQNHGAFNTPSASIWYEWVAPNTDDVDFDTQGSDYDTALAVYTGTALNNLVQIGSNDDDTLAGNLQSRVSFTPVMSTTYYIAVDGFDGDTGSITLNFGPPPPTITVSGTVKLPGVEVAPAGGLNISVSLFDNVNNVFYFDSIFIAAGTNSVAYDVTMLMASNENLVVQYFCFNCEDYVFAGYYNNSATTFDFSQATLLNDATDQSNIDLTLLSGDVISGTISLPGSSVAPAGGLFFSISATDDVNSEFGLATNPDFFAAGESSLNYKFTVPALGDAEWRLQYFCFNCPDAGYLQSGFHSNSGTVEDLADATLLDGGMDNINKDLVFLREDDSCFVIKASNGNVINFCL